MSSVSAPPLCDVPADLHASRRRFDRAAFARVFNPRSVALVFYVVVGMVASEMVAWTWGQGTESWFFMTGYMTRQWLVTAGLTMLAAATTEALVPDAAPLRSRMRVALLLIIGAAILGALARMALGRSPGMTPEIWRSWFISTVVLWTLLGTLAYWLYSLHRDEERARCRLAEATCEQERLAAQATEAQLKALQAQIEPHFLFNSLATVKRLYETDASRGREMMANLIAYFRAVLPSMRASGSTLGGELELARSYLSILKLRMGERLQFSVDCAPDLATLPLPPMLLPTLVENAIKHGLTPLPEGGRIDVRALRRGDSLCVQVADTGAGFVATSGSGVGLANTRQRLEALYGAGASLQLRVNSPRGVVAELCVPVKVADSE